MFKNAQAAINRLLKAKLNNEKIGIWGDYDPDGSCATVLFYESLIRAGFPAKNLSVVLPDAKKYHRSFNPTHLRLLKNRGVTLIVGIDFGTSDFQQIRLAKKIGFEIIILDHHLQQPGKLPAILINPLQKGDPYPFKHWSGAGVAYKFLEELYPALNVNPKLLENSLDLFAIGMIADFIKRDRANLPLIKKGIKAINSKKRIGLRILLKLAGLKKVDQKSVFCDLAGYIGSLEGNNEDNNIFRLLTTRDPKIALQIGKTIKAKVKKFRSVTQKAVKLGIKIFRKQKPLKLIFWEQNPKISGANSVIASRLNRHFKKPAFIFERDGNFYKGSIRANFLNINTVKAMTTCKNLLTSFGGHPAASGFRLPVKNLVKFKERMERYMDSIKHHG